MTQDVVPTFEDGTEAGTSPALQARPRYIHFGSFQLDREREEVARNGSRLKMRGQVYQVLLALLEKHGDVVTREELRQRLWPTTKHGNYEANINTTVNKLRLLLDDSWEKPLYIETIPRKGYCFLAEPEFSDRLATSRPLVKASAAPATPATDRAAGGLLHARWGDTKSVDSSFKVALVVIGLILAGMLLGTSIVLLWNVHGAPVKPQVLKQVRPFPGLKEWLPHVV
jgi:DNA-binding winged helix-turn-helix (wHTH) protein